MLDIIRSDHLRSCPGSQDDQAKVRRLDQAGDDHVKIHWIHIVDGSEIPAIHLGCLKPVVNNEIFTISTGFLAGFLPSIMDFGWIFVADLLVLMSWGFGDTMRALRTGGYATTHAGGFPRFFGPPWQPMVAMVACWGGTWSYHRQKRTHQEGPKDTQPLNLDLGEKLLSLIYHDLGVSKNRVFHYKPSILGYPYFWKHPFIMISFFVPNLLRCFSLGVSFWAVQDRKNAWEEPKEEKFDTHRPNPTCNAVGSYQPSSDLPCDGFFDGRTWSRTNQTLSFILSFLKTS